VVTSVISEIWHDIALCVIRYYLCLFAKINGYVKFTLTVRVRDGVRIIY